MSSRKRILYFGDKAFDEVVFENQRFGFGTRDGGFDMVNLFYHQCDARRMVVFFGNSWKRALEIDRFADIQNIVVFVKKTVHARQIGQIFRKRGKSNGSVALTGFSFGISRPSENFSDGLFKSDNGFKDSDQINESVNNIIVQKPNGFSINGICRRY